jgi:hypothetical protein
MLAALWGKIQVWVAIIAAALAAALGIYWTGRRSGKQDAALDAAHDALKSVKEKDDVVAEVDAMDDRAVRDRAKQRMRDGR